MIHRPASHRAEPDLFTFTVRWHRKRRLAGMPLAAGQIAKALTSQHPQRNISDNLMRTTTERLVARSRTGRTEQGPPSTTQPPSRTTPGTPPPRRTRKQLGSAPERANKAPSCRPSATVPLTAWPPFQLSWFRNGASGLRVRHEWCHRAGRHRRTADGGLGTGFTRAGRATRVADGQAVERTSSMLWTSRPSRSRRPTLPL